MLTRRFFLGTTAGAAGLLGFFGRLRFRPQRRGRAMLTVNFLDFQISRFENETLIASYRGQEMNPTPKANGFVRFSIESGDELAEIEAACGDGNSILLGSAMRSRLGNCSQTITGWQPIA